MKKIVISISLVIIAIILIALTFDWGRREVKSPELIDVASTTSDISVSTSTKGLPIIVSNIKDNQEVSNPLKIVGKAKGSWFFEATFPIELIDANDNIISSGVGKADGEWMTEDFVSFTATLDFVKPTSTAHAILVLSKDNPSGNPDQDQSIFIPVILK